MRDGKSGKEYDVEATLVFIVDGQKILLAPKREKIGKNRLNGYGGKVEGCDPSVEFRATLEMRQESGLACAAGDLQKVAIGHFTNITDDGEMFVWKVHIFLVEKSKCIGKLAATKEMGQPKWFDLEKLPFDDMMAADRYWLPEIFKGRKIVVRATLKNKQSELKGKVEIVEVESFC